MKHADSIPVFTLFGETDQFPDVVHCERIKDRASDLGWVISPHRHTQMAQIFHIQSGHADAQFDGTSLRLNDGEFLFVPPQVVHGFSFAQGVRGRVMSFPMTVVNSLGPASSDATQTLASPITGVANEALATCIALLESTLTGTEDFRAQIAVGLAHAVLGGVATVGFTANALQERSHPNHLARLDTLITQNLGKGWRPIDYASALSISTGHLSRLCRSARGTSASTYIETATMSEACRLLAFTQMSVAEAGYRLGYSDPSYFSRRFRVIQGLTPSDYRLRFVA